MNISKYFLLPVILFSSIILLSSCYHDEYEDSDYGSSSSTTSTTSTSSTSSGSSQCDHESSAYQPYGDVQFDSLCQTAKVYQCAGQVSAVAQTCSTLSSFLSQTGSSSVNSCPAC